MSAAHVPSIAVAEDAPTALLCTRCGDYLNVPPIMTSNEENICGRCYHPEDFTDETRPFRNLPFELLSVMYAFPCKYRKHGCTERKRGEAYSIHEESCLHRPYKCFVKDCHWSEIIVNLQSHVEQTHPDLFIRSGLVHINTDSDYETAKLVLDKHVLYVLQTKFDKLSSKFWLDAVHVATTQYHKIHRLELEFSSHRTTLLFKIAFSDQFRPIDTKTALELDISSLSALLGNPAELTGCLSLFMHYGEGLMNVDLLTELECRVCRVYMVAPIFLCANGHSICEYCSERVTSCPTCRDPLGNVHNFVLEEVVKLMYYPCKYNINSCRYISASTEIRKHEEDCIFKL